MDQIWIQYGSILDDSRGDSKIRGVHFLAEFMTGSNMDQLWIQYGFDMDSIWIQCGFNMDPFWMILGGIPKFRASIFKQDQIWIHSG